MAQEIIKDIPQTQVQQTVDDFQSEGYKTEVKKQDNGLYTVIATK